MTISDLQECSKHILYEMEMFNFAAGMIERLKKQTSGAESGMDIESIRLRRAILENFLQHTRNLRDFLRKDQSKKQPDDILAICYLDRVNPIFS